MKLAVIPARGGSKRIPRKNVKSFFGKPMIAWSIEAALRSDCFDKVIISTDDAEIAHIAQEYGGEVPFVRPSCLSDDYTPTTPVISHAIRWCTKHAVAPTKVCCIYATAPFVRPEDLREGLDNLLNLECDYSISVTSYAFPIQRAIRINKSNRIEMFQPEHFLTRSQDLEECYHDAAQFYWGTADAWLQERAVFGPGSVPIVLPRHRVQDIDTPEDWLRAEGLFKVIQSDKT